MASLKCDVCYKCFEHKENYDRHVISHDVEKIVAHANWNEMDNKIDIDKKPFAAYSNSPKPCFSATLPSKETKTFVIVKDNTVAPNHTVSPKLKPYFCDQCEKSYTRKDHLNRHKLDHLGVREHVCATCLKAFVRKDKLQRHEQTVHFKDTTHPCTYCDKVFLRKDGLKKHLRIHQNATSEKSNQTAEQSVQQRQEQNKEGQSTTGTSESADSAIQKSNEILLAQVSQQKTPHLDLLNHEPYPSVGNHIIGQISTNTISNELSHNSAHKALMGNLEPGYMESIVQSAKQHQMSYGRSASYPQYPGLQLQMKCEPGESGQLKSGHGQEPPCSAGQSKPVML